MAKKNVAQEAREAYPSNASKQLLSKYEKDEWDTGDDTSSKICKSCDWSDNLVAGSIKITPEVYTVIKKLCSDVKDEWQMLLKGEERENGDVYVDGYYIPKQEVTGATVKNLDCIDQEFIDTNRIVATIHSHSTMSCFFSATDEEFTNMSMIDTHIVVNNKGEHKACMKTNLPCGMVKFFDTKVNVDYTMPDVEVEGQDNIQKRTVKSYYQKQWWEKDDKDKKDKKKEDKDIEYNMKYALQPENAHMYGVYGRYAGY